MGTARRSWLARFKFKKILSSRMLLCFHYITVSFTKWYPKENRNSSLYSQPLSLIMWASSMMNFPSLYF